MSTATKRQVRTSAPEAVAIYCRISLDRSGGGLGVDRQEKLCRKLARARGWTVAGVYVDNDKSAFTGKPRPGYARMLADLNAGLRDAVIAVDQDRVVRRMAELAPLLELLERIGAPIVTTDGELDSTTADGILRLHILGAVAENESRKKGERVAREAEQAALRGVPRGSRRPFGFESDRTTIRADEADLIREAANQILDGWTIPSIARDWNERQIPTPQHATHGWSAQTVAGILRNPRIAGLRAYKGEIVADGTWPAIIDRKTFDRLQGKIRRTARPGRPARRLLTAIAVCGKCKSPMWTSTQYGGPRPVARYACVKRPGAPGCGGTTIVAEPFEQLIADAVVVRLDSAAVARALRKPKAAKTAPGDDLARIERDLEDLAADFGAGTITRREWLSARKPLEDRLVRARAISETDAGTSALAPFAKADVREVWNNLDVDRRRSVLAVLIDQITIGTTRPGCNAFDPDRVDVTWKL